LSAIVNSNAMTGATLRTAAVSRRILPIDAARGLVMLFSCLAHFAWWIHAAYPDASATLAGIGMVATPTFLMLSGAMAGMLCAAAGQERRDLKSQLFNRGLFLLTVGHLFIALAEAHLSGSLVRTIRGVTVVDEIGLCTLTAAFFVPQLANSEICWKIARRAVIVLCIVWMYNVFWLPANGSSLAFEQILIGGNIASGNFTAHTPVLQHLAIYAIGLPLGHFFASYVRREISLQTVASRLALIGALLASTAIVLRVARQFFDHLPALHSAAMDLTLKLTEKTPPSPGYLLFFGGCALLLISTLFRLTVNTRRWIQASLEWLAVIGRASLLIFVLQYFLYWTLPDLLDIHPNKLAAGFFIANVLLIRLVAGAWGRLRGNRWMTFGIKLRRTSPLGPG
jgi:uncharacterized membrane protein